MDTLECDKFKVARISCEGMRELFAVPCLYLYGLSGGFKVARSIGPKDKNWVELANKIACKIIPRGIEGDLYHYHIVGTIQFNWKNKTQYLFVRYLYSIPPAWETLEKCVYLGKNPFKWGTWGETSADPFVIFRKFGDLPINEDGKLDFDTGIGGSGPENVPDPQYYTDEQLEFIDEYEKATVFYNQRNALCIARYENLNATAVHKETKMVGIITKIEIQERGWAWWDKKDTKRGKRTSGKDWFRYRPLKYTVETEDKKLFHATGREIWTY